MILDCVRYVSYFFFFFQAEDGIRDLTVTGVQTCALPISRLQGRTSERADRRLRSERDYSEGDRQTCVRDRKSTRLNSSHSQISYAVFCLKKKKKNNQDIIKQYKYTTQNKAHCEHRNDRGH